MKNKCLISLVVVSLFGLLLFLFPGVWAVADIEHTDSTGDVEYIGIEDTELHDNIDITLLSSETTGDPIVLELTTLAGITIETSGMDYHYYFYLDITGDKSADLTVTITEDDQYITGDTVDGTNSPISDVSGEGTSTLTVELPLDLFTIVPSVVDVSACSEIRDGGYWAHDYVNKDFKGDSSEVEITPPSDNEDPAQATPTDPSLKLTIDSFTMDISSTETSYDYTITATGTGSDDIIKGFYCIWAYGEGGGGPQQSWEGSPIDEEHSYGGHDYNEEFFGTGTDGSWSTWKWTFHSKGPIDDNNREKFEDPESYWMGLESMILYVRGYDENGDWDQDSKDITSEYTGIGSSGGDDDTSDDDTVDDDTSDDDTADDDNDKDSPGFEIYLIACACAIATLMFIKRRKD
ncbi:MAG: hypothetical protein JXA22_04040 [Candidatus Thermoplasmatota archaeon]|nr:hypothetical protein [Candidatus Thermoplasmatota archaeon]